MKIRPAKNQIIGMTLVEVVIVIFVVFILLIFFILPFHDSKYKMERINCINNLKEYGLAFKVWEGDNGNKYPMQFCVTNTETMKSLSTGNAWVMWRTMSNELATPKILYCTADKDRTAVASFTNLTDANISYFFNLDAADNYPQMILDGDDNLTVNEVRVPPGILNLRTNVFVAWTKERHHGDGNLGMADCSVQQATVTGLNGALVNSGFATNRLVIP